jgi:hypothetical protein
VTDRDHLTIPTVNRDDAWLIYNDALPLCMNEGVRGSEVDPEIFRERSENRAEHIRM